MQLKQKKIDFNIISDDNKLLVFNEINNHILLDEKPSLFLDSISDTEIFKKYPFSMLYKLKETDQSPICLLYTSRCV